MPEIRVRVSEEDFKEVERKANAVGKTIPDYVRGLLLERDSIFTPIEAVKRARKNLKSGDVFDLPLLYSDQEWSQLSKGPAGAFGKNFFIYVTKKEPGIIEYIDGGNNGRRARYRLI